MLHALPIASLSLTSSTDFPGFTSHDTSIRTLDRQRDISAFDIFSSRSALQSLIILIPQKNDEQLNRIGPKCHHCRIEDDESNIITFSFTSSSES